MYGQPGEEIVLPLQNGSVNLAGAQTCGITVAARLLLADPRILIQHADTERLVWHQCTPVPKATAPVPSPQRPEEAGAPLDVGMIPAPTRRGSCRRRHRTQLEAHNRGCPPAAQVPTFSPGRSQGGAPATDVGAVGRASPRAHWAPPHS
ncbi:hypothetical protein C0214_06740 [Methylobacterium sp. DM1]|uniref:Uncharacterized protein n=2 Tax=Methylorubrum extorquens TaxID=408 RepID=C5B3S5_METEA|nr:Hypothetical protein MexAM1_META2p0199 [Methylorubrum extorquens AM1]AWI88002.1 hypothetical protein C0214_06740 [Methylobacterium sp. DM1]CAX22869.1 protein of unknown function [Methylorubrum extorquens DM4]